VPNRHSAVNHVRGQGNGGCFTDRAICQRRDCRFGSGEAVPAGREWLAPGCRVWRGRCSNWRVESNIIRTPLINERILPGLNYHLKVALPRSTSGRRETAMYDLRSRDNAADCLLAAQEACEPYYRQLQLSMAASWLSLARQNEAMDNLLTSSNTA
jgi:hypothetical protein